MTAVNKVAIAGSGVAGLATAIQLAKAGVVVDVFEVEAGTRAHSAPGISLQGNALRVFDALGAGTTSARPATRSRDSISGRPGRVRPVVAELPEVKTGGPDYPAAWGCRVLNSPGSCSGTPRRRRERAVRR